MRTFACSEMLVNLVLCRKDQMPWRLCWRRSMPTRGAELRDVLGGNHSASTMESESPSCAYLGVRCDRVTTYINSGHLGLYCDPARNTLC